LQSGGDGWEQVRHGHDLVCRRSVSGERRQRRRELDEWVERTLGYLAFDLKGDAVAAYRAIQIDKEAVSCVLKALVSRRAGSSRSLSLCSSLTFFLSVLFSLLLCVFGPEASQLRFAFSFLSFLFDTLKFYLKLLL
jgi:hypothetical protein